MKPSFPSLYVDLENCQKCMVYVCFAGANINLKLSGVIVSQEDIMG